MDTTLFAQSHMYFSNEICSANDKFDGITMIIPTSFNGFAIQIYKFIWVLFFACIKLYK